MSVVQVLLHLCRCRGAPTPLHCRVIYFSGIIIPPGSVDSQHKSENNCEKTPASPRSQRFSVKKVEKTLKLWRVIIGIFTAITFCCSIFLLGTARFVWIFQINQTARNQRCDVSLDGMSHRFDAKEVCDLLASTWSFAKRQQLAFWGRNYN